MQIWVELVDTFPGFVMEWQQGNQNEKRFRQGIILEEVKLMSILLLQFQHTFHLGTIWSIHHIQFLSTGHLDTSLKFVQASHKSHQYYDDYFPKTWFILYQPICVECNQNLNKTLLCSQACYYSFQYFTRYTKSINLNHCLVQSKIHCIQIQKFDIKEQ